MSKYYKAEDVIRKRAEDLADTSYWEYGNPKNTDDWIEVAKMEFKHLPTIEIVHCWECRHRASGRLGKMCIGRLPDDFCSYGERIEE